MNNNIKESDISEENAKYLYLKYKGKYFRLKNKLKGNGPTPPATPPKSTSMFKSMSGISSSLFKKTPTPVEKVNVGLDGKINKLKSFIDSSVSEADNKFKETILNLTDYFNAMKNIEGYNKSIDVTYTKYFENIDSLEKIPEDFKDLSPDDISKAQDKINKNIEIKKKLKQKKEIIEKLNDECTKYKTKLNEEELKIKSSDLIQFKKNIVLDCLSPPDETKTEITRKKLNEEKKKYNITH